MYTNKCIKCGCEFETKNPKRVICPNCLYPERKPGATSDDGQTSGSGQEMAPRTSYSSYSAGSDHPNSYSSQRMSSGGNYNRQNSGYSNQRYNNNNNYNKAYNSQYRRDGQNNGGYRNNSYNSAQRPYGQNQRKPQQRSYNQQRGGGFKPRFQQGSKRDSSKRLLITKEQMLEIENLYKAMLPLPNHDAYEVIAEKLNIEPRKVFFGINLIRQKLMLPKLNFPKRKLAVTEDQVFAIKNLYEPLLPLPPIGCHKIIAAQLKMDEWRVHVGIGVVRRQMGLERWNLERTDIPESLREKEAQSKIRKAEKKAAEKAKKAELKKQRELEKALKEEEAKKQGEIEASEQAVITETASNEEVVENKTLNEEGVIIAAHSDSVENESDEQVKETATKTRRRVVKKAEPTEE